MDGSTHKKIAPVFTLGTTYLTVVARGMEPTPALATVALATGLSVLSANWPDADLAAMKKPIPAIWAGTFLGRIMGVRKARVANSTKGKPRKTVYIYKKKRYTLTHGLDMKIWATFFRMVGVRGHRVWQSHSPLVWIPLVLFLYSAQITHIGDDTFITALLTAIPLGLGGGYISHLLGDALTYSGLPLLPKFTFLWKIPILGPMFKAIYDIFGSLTVARFGFAKASSKTWNNIVLTAIGIFVAWLIFPTEVATIFNLIVTSIKNLVMSIWAS